MSRRVGLSRRRALALAGLGVVGLGVAVGVESLPSPDEDLGAGAALHDDLAGVPDGPLDGRVSLSGHRWTAMGAPGDPAPVIVDGAIGAPRDHVPGRSSGPGDPNPTAAAGYAFLETGGVVGRTGAEFRWQPSTTRTSTLALGALTPVPGTNGTRRMSHMHLSVSPSTCAFAVFSRGAGVDYTSLVAEGRSAPVAVLDDPMRCDGTTAYRAEVVVDRAAATATVTVAGTGPLVYSHPLIGAVPATAAFWEYYSVPGGTDLPRFGRIWADPVPPAAR